MEEPVKLSEDAARAVIEICMGAWRRHLAEQEAQEATQESREEAV